MTGVFWLGLLTGLPSSSKRSFGEPADLIILKRFRNDRICLFDDISISWIPALRARMTGVFWLGLLTGLPSSSKRSFGDPAYLINIWVMYSIPTIFNNWLDSRTLCENDELAGSPNLTV